MLEVKERKTVHSGRRIFERWNEYTAELYNDDTRSTEQIKFYDKLSRPSITKDEIRNAINEIPNGKAVGPYELPNELVKLLEEDAIDFLHGLMNQIYDSGQLPEELLRSIFVAIPKISGTTACGKHRTIVLMSHTVKILLRIIIL